MSDLVSFMEHNGVRCHMMYKDRQAGGVTMDNPTVDQLLQDYFIILGKIIRLNAALENIIAELIEAWNDAA